MPRGSDNEESSARLAQTTLAEAGTSLEVAHRIAGLVLATQHLTIPSEPDADLLCDIDLSILGRTPDVSMVRARSESMLGARAGVSQCGARILAGFAAPCTFRRLFRDLRLRRATVAGRDELGG